MPPPAPSALLKYAKLGYHHLVSNVLLIGLACLAAKFLLRRDFALPYVIHRPLDQLHFLAATVAVASAAAAYLMSRPRPVFLVDYSCFKPPFTCRVPFATFMEHSRLINSDQRSVDFQMRILERSGLGEETCLPPANHYIPPRPTMDAARAEAELVIFSAVDDLVARTGLRPHKDVDILVVNCSLFSPTPSLSAMLVNRYKMRSNVRSFNLSGMGCSAGLLSVSLARDLLQVHPNSAALVVSTEIITPNWYAGDQRAMLLPNCLFRMGGAAVLLSNRRRDRRRAKYRLMHVVRTHRGADDRAYRCVQQEEDARSHTGISLSKDLMAIAGEALRSNITTIAPLVLPASEQLLFVLALAGRKVLPRRVAINPYIPDFKRAFEHFCIHAGGRAVIDELQKSLDLSPEHVEASRMALHRFGNTSSSSLWYELAYIEAKGRMRRGDRVWQIGFGSGFKCNSAVWRCNRTIPAPVRGGPWEDSVERYPVHIPDVVKL